MAKRQYRGTVQAEVAALTRQRILEAALLLAEDRWIDEITLDQIAEKAGVTVQTVLRHFASKDGLAVAVTRMGRDRVTIQRNEAVAGDLENIVNNLAEHYEQVGDSVFRTLAREEILPQLTEFLEEGRQIHHQWVERVFAPQLQSLNPQERDQVIIQLIAACDVYLWKLLRRDLRLTPEQYRRLLHNMLVKLLNPLSGE